MLTYASIDRAQGERAGPRRRVGPTTRADGPTGAGGRRAQRAAHALRPSAVPARLVQRACASCSSSGATPCSDCAEHEAKHDSDGQAATGRA